MRGYFEFNVVYSLLLFILVSIYYLINFGIGIGLEYGLAFIYFGKSICLCFY